MSTWIYEKLDDIIEHIDGDLKLGYPLAERLSTKMSRLSPLSLESKTLDEYDNLFNFSTLPLVERMSKISKILLLLGQFLLEILKRFTTDSGFKIRWWQYPAAVSLLVKFIYDLKEPNPVK